MSGHGAGRRVPFHKMHGCGNDFVFIDNRLARVPVEAMPDWARALCRLHTGVGADGLVFLDLTPPDWADPLFGPGAESPAGQAGRVGRAGQAPPADGNRAAGDGGIRPDSIRPDYIWHFYNADGSRATMCGNASRCAALLAVELGLAGPRHVLGTDAGPVRAAVNERTGEAEVELPPVRDVRPGVSLEVGGEPFLVLHADTGVPHAVIFLDPGEEVDAVDVRRIGSALRRHPHFAPEGANVNFASVAGPAAIRLRTYERGVEDETLACGTGAAATAYLAFLLGLTGPDVRLTTPGGEQLGIRIRSGPGGDRPFLSGKAIKVFAGELSLEAVGLPPERAPS